MRRHDDCGFSYSRGSLIQGGILVDVSEQAKAVGIEFPVAVGASLAQQLDPNQFLSTFGITFEERIGNILTILKGHLVPSSESKTEGLPGDRVMFPFIVLRGPLIKEELVSVLAIIHKGDDGTDVVTLTMGGTDGQAA